MVDDDPAVAGAAAVLGLGGANKISVTILLEFVFSVETFLAYIRADLQSMQLNFHWQVWRS